MTSLILKKNFDCNQGAVRAVRYNVDGSYCLTCGADKKIKLWNPHKALLLKTYGGHADEITDAAGSCDSCHIVSSSLDKSVIYWDVTTGQPLRRLRSHAGGVNCVRFNEDSTVAISGSRDNTVMCWDVRSRTYEPIQTMKDAKDCITTVIITDHKIISSSLDGGIRHYDIRARECVTDMINRSIVHITQTKDEQCILAACTDSVLRLVDNDSGEILSEYEGHKTEDFRVECGVLSNDSQVVSGTTEGKAVIWDLLQAKETAKLEIGEGVVNSLCTHPTKTEIMFANKRSIYLFGSNEE